MAEPQASYQEEYFTGALTSTVVRTVERLVREQCVRRLWTIDPSLFTDDFDAAKSIPSQMGFLRAPEFMATEWNALTAFVRQIYHSGVRKALVLASGAEAASARVFLETLGQNPGFPEVRVLDDAEPKRLSEVEEWVEPGATLFVVMVKAEISAELESLEAYFWGKLEGTVADPQRFFVAVSEPGGPLLRLARRRRYFRVFENPIDITARYAAFSYFGMLPAALAGADGAQTLASAHRMGERCSPAIPIEQNSALRLASFLGGLFLVGRDKLTLILAPELKPLGRYIEQLVMGSTGKRKQGLVVVDGEPLGSAQAYGADRVFFYLRLGAERTALDEQVDSLVVAGFPVATTTLGQRSGVGAEVLRWQLATVLFCTTIGVNPLDESDLAQTRSGTQRFLEAYAKDSVLPKWRASSPTEEPLGELLKALRRFDYVSIGAFFEETDARQRTLQEIRRLLRSSFAVASTLGFGARGLYSTGGAARTGPVGGVHLLLTAMPEGDVAIPEKLYTFAVIRDAQALAHLQLLQHHERRTLRLHLGADIDQGLVLLRDRIQALSAAPGR
ncbi:MAG: hypothetical protein SFV15_27285 [Polyangiaceae bacterium]|nr:hypothetical protein [Polyangiaceae bacterium]